MTDVTGGEQQVAQKFGANVRTIKRHLRAAEEENT
jgi:hypothetical protein